MRCTRSDHFLPACARTCLQVQFSSRYSRARASSPKTARSWAPPTQLKPPQARFAKIAVRTSKPMQCTVPMVRKQPPLRSLSFSNRKRSFDLPSKQFTDSRALRGEAKYKGFELQRF